MSALSQYPGRVREFSSVAEMQEHYKRLRAQTFKPVVRVVEPEVAVKRDDFPRVDVAKVLPAPKPNDAHFKRMAAGFWCPSMPPKRIVKAIAEQAGFDPDAVLGERRNHPIVEVRQQAMVTLVLCKPSMSLAGIARVFGRDHTTLLHTLRKHGVEHSRLAPIGLHEQYAASVTDDQVLGAYKLTGSMVKTARLLGVSEKVVRNAVYRMETHGLLSRKAVEREKKKRDAAQLRPVYKTYLRVGSFREAATYHSVGEHVVRKAVMLFGPPKKPFRKSGG